MFVTILFFVSTLSVVLHLDFYTRLSVYIFDTVNLLSNTS